MRKMIALVLCLICPQIWNSAQASDDQSRWIAQWVEKSTTPYYPQGVGPRGWHELIFDSFNSRIALFGGAGSGGYLNDVWQYDALTDMWLPIETPSNRCPGYSGFSGPDGRDNHAVEYDPVNHLYWSIGGSGYKCGPLASRTAQVGSNSTTIIDPSLSSNIPDFYKDWTVTANSKQVYVKSYDPVIKSLGLASPISGLTVGISYKLQVWTNGGTWYYSPSTREWRNLENPHWGSYIGPSPSQNGRGGAAIAYSSQDKVIVLFGGHQNGNGLNDTWVLDLATKTWIQKLPNNPVGFPLRRKAILGSMVYDSQNDVFILFGGRCSDSRCPVDGTLLNETWAYKLSTNTWTQKFPAVSPPPRMEHRLAYDSEHSVILLFGGSSIDYYKASPKADHLLNDLWAYDYLSNTWTELTPSVSPSRRYLHALEYDPISKLTILYGGSIPASVGDVWALQLTATGNPINQAPTAIALVDPERGELGTVFSFDGSNSTDSDGVIAQYQWNFNDGAVVTGSSVNHQFAAVGNYAVTLTVTDDQGATSQGVINVEVTPAILPPPQIEVTQVRIMGNVSDSAISQVIVNGTIVPVTGGDFDALVPLSDSLTSVTIQATGAGGTTIKSLTISSP